MNIFEVIGWIMALAFCLYMTFITAACIIGELDFIGELTPISKVLSGVTTIFWLIFLWLQPISFFVKPA